MNFFSLPLDLTHYLSISLTLLRYHWPALFLVIGIGIVDSIHYYYFNIFLGYYSFSVNLTFKVNNYFVIRETRRESASVDEWKCQK